MQTALTKISRWCRDKGLGINPNKCTIVPFSRKRDIYIDPLTLNDRELEVAAKVKYLGVILDSKLTWNPHLDKTVSKATIAIWSCKRMIGRSWGIKPKMLKWLYTAVVRPMITYAALVWWEKAEQTKARQRLERVQRLMCLGITGAMRTCPTAAMEVILGLPPLHIWLQREAISSAIRLQADWTNVGNLQGHIKVLGRFKELDKVRALSDEIPKRYNFGKNYRVQYPDRKAWTERGGPEFEKGSQVWFTDGSLKEGKAGMGIVGPNCEYCMALGTQTTVFQAEILAIEEAVRRNLDRGLKRQKIYIVSDSQASLKALEAYQITSKLVWECLELIKLLGRNNRLTLVWVPGHEGIGGNERADALARQGAEASLIGPEPFCGISKTQIRKEIRTWEREEWERYWNGRPGLIHSKRFIQPDKIRVEFFIGMERKELSMVVAMLTGHSPLRYHMSKIGVEEDPYCRLCLEEEETAEHILCDCEALAYKRLQHFGVAIAKPQDINKADPRDLKQFVKGLRGLWN